MKSNYLPTDYQSFIATSRYSRWLEEEGRRETWGETVRRYMLGVVLPKMVDDVACYDFTTEVEQAILNLDVMPSMRAVMSAGPALDRITHERLH
jgi:ribonucleoside-diphosphate reductase alpha chain